MSLQQIGCTYDDVVVVALRHPKWFWLNDHDLTQQRYRNAIGALDHLFTNIYPGLLVFLNQTINQSTINHLLLKIYSKEKC